MHVSKILLSFFPLATNYFGEKMQHGRLKILLCRSRYLNWDFWLAATTWFNTIGIFLYRQLNWWLRKWIIRSFKDVSIKDQGQSRQWWRILLPSWFILRSLPIRYKLIDFPSSLLFYYQDLKIVLTLYRYRLWSFITSPHLK